ncbi:hypothetical protein D9758_009213 [Tetrapyrgos nigripes]|uniref:RRM domain-containing protein n=1 Tax=Tetrapyrgos nigripes TaxID=182062 RepID=A0A8H5FX61_9AGAR|nr:hypothetical protein D9758_009213 [Tetrapyrgos nigripes]
MSFPLRRCPRSLPFPSFYTSPGRCARQFSDLSTPQARPPLPSRVIVINNFPSISSVYDFLSLEGTHHPIEYIRRIPQRDQVLIRYLEAASAKYVWYLGNNKKLALDGQLLSIASRVPRRLPVELVAAIGLKGASRMIVIRDRGLTKEQVEEEMTRRFGEVERIWVGGKVSIVFFYEMQTAIKAQKTLHDEGWSVDFYERLPRRTSSKRKDSDPGHQAVLLSGLQNATARTVLRDLDNVLRFQNRDLVRVQCTKSGDAARLIFSDPFNAKQLVKFYKPTSGVHTLLVPATPPPSERERAAIQLGASRTVVIDGYKDPWISFDRLHQDFGKFGDIFYIYKNPEKAHARVVFTDITSSLKIIEHVHENRGEYDVYHGARITFACRLKNAGEISPLRPIFIRPTLSDKLTLSLPKSDASTTENLRTSHLGTTALDANEDYDDWQYIDCSPDLGEVHWIERQNEATGLCRLDVRPRRNEQS